MRFLRSLKFSRYDPVAYWNTRENPNNEQGLEPARIRFDTGFIRAAVAELDPVLELGPGVGRTFEAYSKEQHITTLDLSRIYSERLILRAKELGLTLSQNFLSNPDQRYPFNDGEFAVGVASQVFLHVPPEIIYHSVSEMMRVCKKVVVISYYEHGVPTSPKSGTSCFNHDYFTIVTEIGCEMNNVIMNERRICFTIRRLC